MAYCAHCGKQLVDGARFCSACGREIITPSSTDSQAPSQPESARRALLDSVQNSGTSKPSSKRSLWMRLFDAAIIAVSVKLFGVLVPFAAVLAYWWLDKRERWLQVCGAAGAGIVAAILVMAFIPPRDELLKQAPEHATGVIGEPSSTLPTVNSASDPTAAAATSPAPVASDEVVDPATTTPAVAQQATSPVTAPTTSTLPYSGDYDPLPGAVPSADEPAASTPAASNYFDQFDSADQTKSSDTTKAPQKPATSAGPTGDVEGKQRFTGKPVSMHFLDVPLATVAQLFSEETGIPFQVDPQKRNLHMSINFVNEPWDKALNDLLVRYNLKVRMINGVAYVY